MAGEMIRVERAWTWLGSRYFVLGALGLVSSLTSLMLAALLMGNAAPSWTYAFLRICGFDPVRGSAPFGRVALLVLQAYLTVGVLAFFFWQDLKWLWSQAPSRVSLTILLVSPLVVFSLGTGAGRIEVAAPYSQPMVREGSPAPDFQLMDSSGGTVKLSDYRGRAVLLTFFYSNCAEACPPLLSRLKETMARWQGAETPVALAITLDPERDTPQQLALFAGRLGLDSRNTQLLTGARNELETVWRTYGAETRPLPGGVVGHDVRIVLIDRQGRTAYTFYGLDYPERWLNNALQLLLEERL